MSDHMKTRNALTMAARTGLPIVLLICLTSGCAHTPNQFCETGPSVNAEWDSPTGADVRERFQPAPPRNRGWDPVAVSSTSGAVTHYPLYFEDPFEDKAHGRTDETSPHNVYHIGWEDYIALAYCPTRAVLNGALLPISAVVTPPWQAMESDGRLSRQILGYDHDATRLGSNADDEPAPSEPQPAPEPEQPQEEPIAEESVA